MSEEPRKAFELFTCKICGHFTINSMCWCESCSKKFAKEIFKKIFPELVEIDKTFKELLGI